MSPSMRFILLVLLVSLAPRVVVGQPRPFHFAVPPLDAVRLTRGITYASVDSVTLAMDVYRPKDAQGLSPALVLYSLYWPESGDRPSREANDHVVQWARIAAANGIVAVIPDLRAVPGTGTAQAPTRARAEDFDRFVTHLGEHASEYGIDAKRIALFAASGSVAAVLPAIEDPARQEISAAVLYYGGAGAQVARFRGDLPILHVRAGKDSPRMNAEIDRVTSLAVSQNVPITVINYANGHHGFEAVDDNAATRAIIRQTIEFVKEATSAEYQRALEP
jgi:dienelactone hydrolase